MRADKKKRVIKMVQAVLARFLGMAPKKRQAADHCIRLPPRELSALGDPAARPVAPALLPFNEGPWTQPRPAPEVPTPSQAIVSTGASSSSSSHVVAGRSDTPVMQPYTRGDRELLMRLAEDAATRAECADEMQARRHHHTQL